jgi:hypothetical protein
MYDRDYAACPANYYHDGPSTPNRDRNPRSDPIPGSWGSSPRRYHRDPRDPRCAHHWHPGRRCAGGRAPACSVQYPSPSPRLSDPRFYSIGDSPRSFSIRVRGRAAGDSESARRPGSPGRGGSGSGSDSDRGSCLDTVWQKHGPTRISIRTGDSTTPCFRLGVLRVRVFLSSSESNSLAKDARSD